MKIGLLIAVERELKSFLACGRELTEERNGGRSVWTTEISGHSVVALCSGWGEIDAAAGTQLLITRYGCEAVFNFGVTGALVPGLRVEDLFLVRRVCHYDFDTSPIDAVRKHQYAEFPDEFIPLDDALIAQAHRAVPGLRECAVASGDRFVEDPEDKRSLAALGCDICDMEIAAIARVCFLNRVPCLSVKCISDTFEGNGGDYQANVRRSAEKAFAVLLTIMDRLESGGENGIGN